MGFAKQKELPKTRVAERRKDVSYEDWYSSYNVLAPVYERILDDTIAGEQETIENSDRADDFEYQSRLKGTSNAAAKLYQKLRLRTEAMGKFRQTSHALTKKAVSVFSTHSRVRAYRSPARSRSKFSAAHDDGDDDGGNSDSSDPPAKPYHTLLNPPKEQPNSFLLSVAVSPWQMLCGLSKGRWAA